MASKKPPKPPRLLPRLALAVTLARDPSRARVPRGAGGGTAIVVMGVSREDKVRAVLDLMMGGEWVPGKSHAELAARWGCAVSSVEQVANEAGRAIRMAIDPVSVQGRMLATLETCARRALHGDDVKGAVAAIMAQAELLGMRKQTVAVVRDPREMSDDEARAALAAAVEQANETLRGTTQ